MTYVYNLLYILFLFSRTSQLMFRWIFRSVACMETRSLITAIVEMQSDLIGVNVGGNASKQAVVRWKINL